MFLLSLCHWPELLISFYALEQGIIFLVDISWTKFDVDGFKEKEEEEEEEEQQQQQQQQQQ